MSTTKNKNSNCATAPIISRYNMYALQSLQPYPPAILKQLRPDQLTKNNTNQPMRWKEIAMCEDIEQLKPHVINENRRIINWDNLEVVYTFRRTNGL